MKFAIISAFLLAGFYSSSVLAQSEVFLCVDERGNKEYKNTGGTKGCKRVELPGITTIEAPRARQVAASGNAAPKVPAPTDFPKADGNAQKARDSDRRQILSDELKNEEQKLANLKKEFNNGEPERQGGERNYAKYQERAASMKQDVERSEKNVEALKREIANLK
ncbi:DUF4124 domain-containing protein [Janthinobacterium sp. 17J80-10]|uniref:DUF4124 domain-containing protein n=1 Tax=Janthinobacterium sp. 17J80-10 TaxID=2497863 RepID=UPI0010056252|nr:DUF4124 domain-containing protein [Janthinobacterium sp. 17J80-10]QAU34111.1 DUF4124 domain-containing protein [Janthinobacterium sp. 17J80-10]